MKQIIFLVFFCLTFKGIAQDMKVADSLQSGYIIYTYKGYETPFAEEATDFNAYLNFNESESLFVTGRVGMKKRQNDGMLTANNDNVGYLAPTSSEKGRMIYRNFTTKEIRYNEFKLAIFPPYVVNDNWVEMKWEFLKGSRKIAGYVTKKATTTFRGTKYTAWYAESIALPYGPHKLFGLPGIILELTTHDVGNTDITFTAYEVCYPCENNQKVETPIEDVVKTIEEEVLFRDNFRYYFVTQTNERSGVNKRLYLDELPSEKEVLNKRKLMPEKIYEWETKDTKRVLPGIDYKSMLNPYRNQNKKEPNYLPGTRQY